MAEGCRLDAQGLAEFVALFDRASQDNVELLILNRFGKAEAEGGGLRPVFARAMEADIPVLTAVRAPYDEAWAHFHGHLASDLPADNERGAGVVPLRGAAIARGGGPRNCRPPAEGHAMNESQTAAIGIVTVSDRASAGTYNDVSGPAIEDFLREVLTTRWRAVRRLIPDGIDSVRDTLIDLADRENCALVFTTGGTGPAPRDLTPEGTIAACTRLMPGFGELMRMESLKQVPTAILSRQTAGIRGATLIVNLPGAAGLHPHDHAGGVSGDPLLPRPDRRGAHRYRSGALQGVPAAAVTLPNRTQGFA